jgi:hypothetical protein
MKIERPLMSNDHVDRERTSLAIFNKFASIRSPSA